MYEILSVYELQSPLTLNDLKTRYRWNRAPRGSGCLLEMTDDFRIDGQTIVHRKREGEQSFCERFLNVDERSDGMSGQTSRQ